MDSQMTKVWRAKGMTTHDFRHKLSVRSVGSEAMACSAVGVWYTHRTVADFLVLDGAGRVSSPHCATLESRELGEHGDCWRHQIETAGSLWL
jgi:hypothetical protein